MPSPASFGAPPSPAMKSIREKQEVLKPSKVVMLQEIPPVGPQQAIKIDAVNGSDDAAVSVKAKPSSAPMDPHRRPVQHTLIQTIQAQHWRPASDQTSLHRKLVGRNGTPLRSGDDLSMVARQPLILDSVVADDLVLQLQISQAMLDANSYRRLSMEEFESISKKVERLRLKMASLKSRFQIESKIRDASTSLLAGHTPGHPKYDALKSRVDGHNRKFEALHRDLMETMETYLLARQMILEHAIMVLAHGVKDAENDMGRSREEMRQLNLRIEELSNEMDRLKAEKPQDGMSRESHGNLVEELQAAQERADAEKVKVSAIQGMLEERQHEIMRLRGDMDKIISERDVLLEQVKSAPVVSEVAPPPMDDKKVKQLEAEIEQLRHELEQKEEDTREIRSAMKQSLAEAMAEKDEYLQKVIEEQSRADEAEKRLAEMDKSMQATRALSESKSAESDVFRQKEEQYQSQVSTLEERVKATSRELEQVKSTQNDVDGTLRKLFRLLPDTSGAFDASRRMSILGHVERHIEQLVAEKSDLSDRITVLQAKTDALKTDLDRERDKNEERARRLENESSSATDEIRMELDMAQLRVRVLEGELEDLREVQLKTKMSLSDMDSKLAEANKKVSEAESVAEEAQKSSEQHKKRVAYFEAELDAAQQEMLAAKAEVLKLERSVAKVSDVESDLEQMKKRENELKDSLASAKADKSQLESQLTKTTKELQEAKERAEEILVSATLKASEDLEHLRGKVKRLESDLKDAQSKKDTLQERYDALKSELDALKKSTEDSLATKAKEFNDEIEKLKAKESKLTKELAEAKKEADEARQQVEDAMKLSLQSSKEASSLRKKVSELETSLEEAKSAQAKSTSEPTPSTLSDVTAKEMEEVKAELAKTKAEADSYIKLAEAAQGDTEKMKFKCNFLEKSLNDARRQITELQELKKQNEELTIELSMAKMQLVEFQTEQDAGTHAKREKQHEKEVQELTVELEKTRRARANLQDERDVLKVGLETQKKRVKELEKRVQQLGKEKAGEKIIKMLMTEQEDEMKAALTEVELLKKLVEKLQGRAVNEDKPDAEKG